MIYLRKSKRNISRLIFHHFGQKPPKGMNVPKIRHMHTVGRAEAGKRPWDDIGYHGVIMPDGEFSIGRDVDTAGAHTWGFNRGSIGIMFMAGLDSDGVTRPNAAQLATARALIEEQEKYYAGLKVMGHGDLRATQCPGFDVAYWYETGKIRGL